MKEQLYFGASASLAVNAGDIEELVCQSRGMDGRSCLQRDTTRWLGAIEPQLPERFWMHDAVGIPTSRIPGIAGNFGRGVVYVIRVPKSVAIRPVPWPPLEIEDEYVILNQVPPGGVVQAIPAERIAPLVVDDDGFLVPGR